MTRTLSERTHAAARRAELPVVVAVLLAQWRALGADSDLAAEMAAWQLDRIFAAYRVQRETPC